jgi:putative hydrolase of the HAD superfamily
VLFDLGGTLFAYGSRGQLGQPAITALRRLGLDPDTAEVQAARRAAAASVERDYALRRSFLHADLFRDRVARTATLLGVDAPVEVLDQFMLETEQSILERLAPKHDALATLQALKERALYAAVVSNADTSWLDPAIRNHGLDALLDDWTSSEEADSCKPDAQIFTYAIAKANLAATDMLFVGDSLEHDIAGARAAGIRSVHITGQGQAPLAGDLEAGAPDFTVVELLEVVGIVDELNGR